jgi:hypothetical protein
LRKVAANQYSPSNYPDTVATRPQSKRALAGDKSLKRNPKCQKVAISAESRASIHFSSFAAPVRTQTGGKSVQDLPPALVEPPGMAGTVVF